MIRNEKAQLYTIEAVASALLLIMVVIFVLKGAPMSPNSSSASHQKVEASLSTRGHDLLRVLDYVHEEERASQLKQAIASWNGMEVSGQAAVRPLGGPTNITANVFKEALSDAGIVYNLEVFFTTSSGISSRPMLWNGKPSDNAVTVSTNIVLNDEDMVLNPELSSMIPEIDPVTTFYNIVEVKLTLWRM
jgi:hypothetical protein